MQSYESRVRKDHDLKSVREIANASQEAKEESVMTDADTAHKAQIEEQEVQRIDKPGRYSAKNNERTNTKTSSRVLANSWT